MAKPTVIETTARVMKAFAKIGFGTKFANYSVVNHAPWIELVSLKNDPGFNYRVLDRKELEERAGNLVQSATGNLIGTVPESVRNANHVCWRILQNMSVYLHGQQKPVAYGYYDSVKGTMIYRVADVIIEIEPRENYQVDISTASIADFLDELGMLDDEVDGYLTFTAYTVMGKLQIRLNSGYVVYPDTTVEEFNSHWEK